MTDKVTIPIKLIHAVLLLQPTKGVLFFLWPPYVIGAIIILPCDFYLSFYLSFLSSPNLSGRRLNVYHTLTHGVALVRI